MEWTQNLRDVHYAAGQACSWEGIITVGGGGGGLQEEEN